MRKFKNVFLKCFNEEKRHFGEIKAAIEQQHFFFSEFSSVELEPEVFF